jgi:hypothetical protein
MPHHRLHLLRVSVSLRLQRVQNPTHLLLLPFRQLNLPRSKVLLQTVRLSRARDGDHALRHHPSQSDLGQSAALALGESLDLLYNLLVVVEVLALEFGDCAAEVIRSEIVGGLVGEVIDEPAVAERAVGHVGDVELAGGGDEAVGFVQGFEGGVFGLDGVDFGDCGCVRDDSGESWEL